MIITSHCDNGERGTASRSMWKRMFLARAWGRHGQISHHSIVHDSAPGFVIGLLDIIYGGDRMNDGKSDLFDGR